MTPGGPAPLTAFRSTDTVVGGGGAQTANAAPSFPASIAVARVQAPEFRADPPLQSRNGGHFSVVTSDQGSASGLLKGISAWPVVAGVSVIDPSTLPEAFNSPGDLRLAAAKLSADVLLIYTVDTSFRVRGQAYGPGYSIPVGTTKPDGDTGITVTASAVFKDVRTGATLASASAVAVASDVASAWPSVKMIDRKRQDTEHKAIELMLTDAQNQWTDIVARLR